MAKPPRPAKSTSGQTAIPAGKAAPQGKQTLPAAEPTRSADSKYVVELRLFASDANPPLFRTIQRTCTDKADYPMVARWNYIVSKRLRLTTAPVGEGLDELERLVATYLRDRTDEPAETFIRELARAEVIEVSIPFHSEKIGWAARLFPWENALSIITRRYRRRSLVVVRHFDRGATSAVSATPPKPESVLVVRSTPGDFARTVDFRSESALVKYKLGCVDAAFTDLDTPTPATIAENLRTKRPDVIHLAALDTHKVTLRHPELVQRAWSDTGRRRCPVTTACNKGPAARPSRLARSSSSLSSRSSTTRPRSARRWKHWTRNSRMPRAVSCGSGPPRDGRNFSPG